MKKIQGVLNLDLYPFFLPLLAWMAGILLYHQFGFLNNQLQLISFCLGISLLTIIVFQFFFSLSKYLKWIRNLLLISCFLFSALIVCYFNDVHHQKTWFGNHIENTNAWMLVIKEEPLKKRKILTLPSQVLARNEDGHWKKTKGNIDVHIYLNDSMLHYKIGDRIVIPNQLVPILNSNNPFAFQQADYAQLQGKYHQAFLPESSVGLISNENFQATFLSKTKSKILNTIYKNVKDSTTASLMAAVIVNERAQLDKDLWQDYSRTGVAHIVAISGMHITLFFSVLAYLLYWIKSRDKAWLKYLIILPLVWGYIAITGFPPSAVRAGIMFSLVSLALFVRREQTLINSLLATAFFILLFRPFWLFDVGFQLSFLSVLSIFIFYKPISKWWQPQNKILNYLWQIIALSISVQILLTPIVIYYFHQISVGSVIANLPAAIYSSVFMVLSLVLIVFGSLGLDMQWLGQFLALLTSGFHVFIQGFSALSPEYFHHLFLKKWEFWLCMLAIVFGAVFAFRKNKLSFVLASIFTFSFFVSLAVRTFQWNKQNHFIVYNVNKKSLMSHIESRQNTLIAPQGIDENDRKYILNPAQIGFGIAQENWINLPHSLLTCKGKKILVLNQNFAMSNQAVFPVDVLIVAENVAFNPELWIQVFQPKKIILDGSIKRYKAQAWKEALEELQIPVHWVLEDGAWIL